MKYVFFTILALFSFNIGLIGQCTGLQIVAFSSDEDKLMIRATADIPGNTVFWITDNEWVSATNSFNNLGEEEIQYTTPMNGLPNGSTVLLELTTATCGSFTGTMLGLSQTGTENVYILNSVPATNPNSTMASNICFTVSFGEGAGGGDVPMTNFVDVGNVDNAYFDSLDVLNPNQWIGSNSIIPFPEPNCLALPVKIINYSLTNQDAKMLLSWTTTEESEHSHFMVEHSSDGKIFIEIGRVESNLERSGNKDYAYVHESPKTGINYYRVVQFDLDGTSTKFDILLAEHKGDGLRFLFPTVTDAQIFLSGIEDGLINLFDGTGKKVLQKQYIKGSSLDMSGFSKGLYYLNIENERFKFFKI
ncbi:MAG TPA: hypothetical protein PLZ32_06640 [Saprospiraceae bacterium]|nr:hypothetical protein [Saprospiraceae bacterium]